MSSASLLAREGYMALRLAPLTTNARKLAESGSREAGLLFHKRGATAARAHACANCLLRRV